MVKQRLIFIDVFRGIVIMMMVIVNNPGDWGHIYAPLEHAHWNGYTPTDLVFPFFLFLVGITTSLSIKRGVKFSWNIFQKISTRALRIFNLGLFLNFFGKINFFESQPILHLLTSICFVLVIFFLLLTDYNGSLKFWVAILVNLTMLCLLFWGGSYFSQVRLPGVLQRIGIVYFIIALCRYRFSIKTLLVGCLVILGGYWIIMTSIPVPDMGRPSLDVGDNLAAFVDRWAFAGHVWSQTKTWDPEGLLSTIPAICTGFLGLFAGYIIKNRREYLLVLFSIAGFLALGLGYLVSIYFPINKSIWTSSFVLVTGGWAYLIMAFLYLIVEKLDCKFWTPPVLTFGVNPMLVFFFSGIIPGLLSIIKFDYQGHIINPWEWFCNYYAGGLFSNPKSASLFVALTYLLIWYFVLLYFYRRKIIIKV